MSGSPTVLNVSGEAASQSAMASTRSLPPFYLIVTFWGQQYREWFLKYTLSSLLAPNNIPALRHPTECKFLICTTLEDWAALENEPTFVLLKTYIEPVFLESHVGSSREYKYVRMSRGHEALTNACYEAQACAIYLAPDTLVPDGCVAEAQRLVATGKRVVLCTAIRFEMEGIENELIATGLRRQSNEPLTVSRRQSVEIGLRNLHSESRAGKWEAPYFGELNPAHRRNQFPACCYWPVPNEDGILIFTHNWAPFVINFKGMANHDTTPFARWAIDGDYIYRNFKTAKDDEIYVVDDSDTMILLGLTPRLEMSTPTPDYFWQRWPAVGVWSKGFILNRALFGRHIEKLRQRIYSIPVRWHSRELSVHWAATEAHARRILDEFTRRDLRPLHTLATLTSVRECLAFVRSVEFPRLLWWIAIFYVLLPLRQFPVKCALYLRLYTRVIRVVFLALCGDSTERARISKRIKAILSAASLKRSQSDG